MTSRGIPELLNHCGPCRAGGGVRGGRARWAGVRPRSVPPPAEWGGGRSGGESGWKYVPPPSAGSGSTRPGIAPRRGGSLGDWDLCVRHRSARERAPELGCVSVSPGGREWGCAGAASPVSLPRASSLTWHSGVVLRAGGSRCSGEPGGRSRCPAAAGETRAQLGLCPAAPNSFVWLVFYLENGS